MAKVRSAQGPGGTEGTASSGRHLVLVPDVPEALPRVRAGVVPRDRLVVRIEASGADVVAVIAGPGYGKTTLLTDWARRDPRSVAWLSLDGRDDDPSVLISDLAFTFDRIYPLDDALLRRLTRSGSRVPTARIRELIRCIEGFGDPFVVVLDDVHLLRSNAALDIVSTLIERIPPASAIALASREIPDLSLPRLRASGRLLELGDADLAMDERETAQLVRGVDPELPEEAIPHIGRRTEGWPVAIYLATVSIREHRDPVEAASRFGGDDRLISEYVRDELLRNLAKRQVRFLTRTAILRELTPGLCDEVVGWRGSAALLAELERSNPLLVPVVGQPGHYRYHQLFRDVLVAELQRTEPDHIPDLYGRAVTWSEANGMWDDAIDYAQAGGHALDAARLVCSITRRYLSRGRLETLGRWLGWFDDEMMLVYPPLAVSAGWYHALAGDAEPLPWLRMAETGSFEGQMPDGSPSFEVAVALLRAALCLEGPERMDTDVALAAGLGTPGNEWSVMHHLVAAEAALLLGDTDRARATLNEAVEFARPAQASGHVMVMSELAAIAADAGAWDEADRWIGLAGSTATSEGLGDIILQPLMFAVSALVLAHRGEPGLAREALIEAQKLRATSSFAMPSFSIRGRLMMARAYLALSDVQGARTVLAEARQFQAHRPNIGALADALDEVDDAVRRVRDAGVSGPGSLSVAELRVLALLPTHLSFPQIGERLFVSRNTVKTQAMSIYSKLGATSRSEAIERSAALGLLNL
jgi:LuxR family maltose regulon positive regulatory protein